jgi:penicillin-binding protein 2
MSKVQRRILVVEVVMGCVLLVFVGRLWQLQVWRWRAFARQAAANRTQTVRVEAPRGLISDRKGRLLAENRRSWRLGIDPSLFPKNDHDADRAVLLLASLIEGNAQQIRVAVKQALAATTAAQPLPLPGLTGELDLPMVARIQERSIELPGVVILETTQRHYPKGELAAHALGYARSITQAQYQENKDLRAPIRGNLDDPASLVPDKLYSQLSVAGQMGVEKACELDRSADPPTPVLVGLPGRTVWEVDVHGERVRVVASRDAQAGASVYLTLDTGVQWAAEKALADTLREGRGTSGAVVALDVNTGEVLALVSRPGFDPNKWVKGLKPEEWKALSEDKRTPMLNKATGGQYAPGSTFKMISSIAAFESVKLQPKTSFECGGRITVGWRHQVFRCWKPGGHGWVDYWRGLSESCDVYFYSLVRSLRLSSEALAYWAREFGLGSTTGIALPGEAEGTVPDPEWKRIVVRDPWRLGDSLNMVIGQGYLTTTPLQLAVATAAIANGGRVYVPQLVRKIIWPKWMGRAPVLAEPGLVRTVGASPASFDLVRRAMRLAVTSEHGTCKVVGGLGVSVAGKTGSAEHKPGTPTHGWFACFAPYEQPQYAVVVFVESGGHGGVVAAPIARKVLAALFGLGERGGGVGPVTSD